MCFGKYNAIEYSRGSTLLHMPEKFRGVTITFMNTFCSIYANIQDMSLNFKAIYA